MPDRKWDLSRLDAGDRTALRRAAVTPGHDMAALRAFYRACGYCEYRFEAYWFVAACMDALWRETDEAVEKPMEECLRILVNLDEATSASLKHRVDMLLETVWGDDGYLTGKMLNLVKIIKSRTGLKPDFHALADDLYCWNDPRHYVQRKWLRCIYNVKTNKEEENNAD